MDKKMETTILYIEVLKGLYRDNGKENGNTVMVLEKCMGG